MIVSPVSRSMTVKSRSGGSIRMLTRSAGRDGVARVTPGQMLASTASPPDFGN
jgi:hypothetical protein